MARKNTMMSENLKEEIAKELGVYDQVKKDGGWQNVSSTIIINLSEYFFFCSSVISISWSIAPFAPFSNASSKKTEPFIFSPFIPN